MPSLVVRAARAAALGSVVAVLAFTPHPVSAQGTGNIAGRVADANGNALPASVTVIGSTRYGGYAGPDGSYVLTDVPAGSYRLRTHFIGFRDDTVAVTVTAGQTATTNITLTALAAALNAVVVTGVYSGQTTAAALQQQKNADNLQNVISEQDIMALPNQNAAEALARIPGVTAERDEGEPKYVEIRGTPPDFQHVTIDGADVPGTLATDVRAVKLDDVPADILGAIEVNKTLSADIDADAIGGSVNLVTKIPEGPLRGYASGLYGYQTLESNNTGHGALTYGGRVGADQKLGFLVTGSIDRTDRVLNDVEPSYTGEILDGQGGFMPVPGSTYTHEQVTELSQREYNYYRTRYGLGEDLDYRFSPTSTISLKGLWSAFFDEASRWETNLEGGADSLIGGVPTATGSKIKYTVANRGPIEHTWGFTGSGKQDFGGLQLTYAANYAGSTANQHNHYQDDYAGPSGFNYTYSANNFIPRAFYGAATSAAIADPTQYTLGTLETDNEQNSGSIVGGKADALVPYAIGDMPAATKFGIKIENQHKGYLSFQPQYSPNTNLTLAQFLSNYSDPGFYNAVCGGCYQLAPFGSLPAVNRNLVNNPGLWTYMTNSTTDSAATFAGTEQTNAAYVMQTVDVHALHINLGLRVENTNIGYVGYVADTLGNIEPTRVHGKSAYTDLFPSMQLKYAIDDNTNLRLAITRGIARPDYIQLAPDILAFGAQGGGISTPITEGNPSLKPEHAWNYDLLGEHYLSNVGIISAGAFYKSINNFIFNRISPYNGPLANGDPDTYVEQPQNGPSATLWGVEFDYMQHLTFLPGLLQGLGYDLNYTHVESRAIVPQDTTAADQGYVDPTTNQLVNPFANQPFRHAAIPRQFPNMYNVSVLYDYSTVSARASGQYTAASIYQYGLNGTSNPQNGDNYNYPHFQIDALLSWRVYSRGAITVQGTNLNNEVFGFFTGTTHHPWNNQREYYGRTLQIGYRQAF